MLQQAACCEGRSVFIGFYLIYLAGPVIELIS